MRLILIDNYDSFTYNLYQLFAELGANVDVIKNDVLSATEIFAKLPTHIVISPGPGTPDDAGVSNDIIRSYSRNPIPHSLPPLLGVCLGHQCIAHVFSPQRNPVRRASKPMHGKTSKIHHDGKGIMRGIPSPFIAARYHSLIVDRLPPEFALMCWTHLRPPAFAGRVFGGQARAHRKTDLIMGMQHATLPIFGVQFHPESFLTDHGRTLAKNFLACS